jgi:hypothetical protein
VAIQRDEIGDRASPAAFTVDSASAVDVARRCASGEVVIKSEEMGPGPPRS